MGAPVMKPDAAGIENCGMDRESTHWLWGISRNQLIDFEKYWNGS